MLDWSDFTVEECKHFEQLFDKQEKSGKYPQNYYKPIKELGLYFKKGERYRNKNDVIAKQIDFIAERKERLEKTNLKTKVLCLLCHKPMDLFDKDFHGYDKNERVLFHLKCNDCNTHRLFFENGEEYRPKPPSCEKCYSEAIEKNHIREGNKITSTYTCRKCKHVEKDIFDLDEKPDEIVDNEGFLKDRDKYCLTDEKGQQYISDRNGMEYFYNYTKKQEEKEKNNKPILNYSI